MNEADRQALETALHMVTRGIPVFVCKPDPSQRDGFRKPAGWQKTVPDLQLLADYQEGDALCMLCGHGLDVIDVDVQNDGDKYRSGLDESGLIPTVYGLARTPSGGSHEFVASLGVRKQQNVWPGIDFQAGDRQGEGGGFVYIAPTVKRSKITGEYRGYSWEQPIDWDRFDRERAEDDTGSELAALIRNRQTETIDWEPYEGRTYNQLDEETRSAVDGWMRQALKGIAQDLKEVGQLPIGQRNDHGDGWEKVTADAALRLCQLARAPWNEMGHEEAWRILKENAPTDDDWTMFDVEQKFRSQSKLAARKPLQLPVSTLATLAGVDAPHPSGAAPDLPTEQEQRTGFWDRRESLSTIRDLARSRRVSPWGLLGVCIGITLASIPNYVQLPALKGGTAGLNSMILMVGRSGCGKGAATKTAHGFLPNDIHRVNLGSGEGVAAAYRHQVDEMVAPEGGNTPKKTGRKVWEWSRRSVIFSTSEGDLVKSSSKRLGATIIPVLRKASLGEDLEVANRSGETSIPVKEGEYRFVGITDIQPGNAGWILDDAVGGLPQRCLWFWCEDPDAPRQKPYPPDRTFLELPSWPDTGGKPMDGRTWVVGVPESVADEIDENLFLGLTGRLDSLDGHSILTREKVAYAVRILDCMYRGITDHDSLLQFTAEDWDLAGQVVEHSNRVRQACLNEVSGAARRAGKSRAVAEAMSKAEAEDLVEARRIEAARVRILEAVDVDGMKRRDIEKLFNYKTRRAVGRPALEALLREGVLVEDEGLVRRPQT